MSFSAPPTPGSSRGTKHTSHCESARIHNTRGTTRRYSTAPVYTPTASSDDERDSLLQPTNGRTRHTSKRRRSTNVQQTDRPSESSPKQQALQHARHHLGLSNVPSSTRAPISKSTTCPNMRPMTISHGLAAYGGPGATSFSSPSGSSSAPSLVSTFFGVFSASYAWVRDRCRAIDFGECSQQQQQQQHDNQRHHHPAILHRYYRSSNSNSTPLVLGRNEPSHSAFPPLPLSLPPFPPPPHPRPRSSPPPAPRRRLTTVISVSDLHEPHRTFIECRRAAEQGEIQAQADLGWMYEYGFRVPRNHDWARRWYLSAALEGHPGAQYHLGLLCEEEDKEEEEEEQRRRENQDKRQCRDTSDSKEKAQLLQEREAREEGGGGGGGGGKEEEQYVMEYQHRNPRVGKDKQLFKEQPLTPAYEWYAKAAKQGVAGAQFKMGAYYDTVSCQLSSQRKPSETPNTGDESREEEQDPATITTKPHQSSIYYDRKAVKWYRRAAQQGHAEAQYRLGAMYTCGRGVYRETSEAYWWLLRAAEQDHCQAQSCLGLLLQQGQGIDGNGHDDVQAVAWFRRAADQGDAEAWFRLGEMYEHGRGVEQDDCKAVACYCRAKDKGHAAAERRYQSMRRRGRGMHQLPVFGPDWVRVVPNYVLGCWVSCRQICRMMVDLESEMLDSSCSSELIL